MEKYEEQLLSFIERLEQNIMVCGSVDYRVVETDIWHNITEYTLHNLDAEIEHGTIMFFDDQDILFQSRDKLLRMFMISSVINIEECNKTATIQLNCGEINILRIK